ncbi:MAG TPA: site-specific integrase [Chitinophagales bacterium]|nr:site-specific integrase [Chitinophagales bacterium]
MRTIQKYVGYYLQRRKIWEGKKDYPRPLMVSFCYHAKYLTTTIGLRVSENNWDYGKQRVKIGVKNGAEINQYLDKLAEKLNDIYFTALSQDIQITNAYLLAQLKRSETKEGEQPKTFWEYYDEYLVVKKRVIKHSSYKSSMTAYNRFKEFCKREKLLAVKFEDITPPLLARYTDFLISHRNTNNTIHSKLKQIRRFMSYAKRLDLHSNLTYKEYNVSPQVKIITFLERDEIKQLMEVQLDSYLETASRDLLLFGCFTGMRYSDIKNLKRTDIKEHRFEGMESVFHAAHIRQVKTSKETVIPLLPEALSILKQYENMRGEYALPQFPLQTVNNALKIVGQKAELTCQQKTEVFVGVERITDYVPKWKILSTHIGRRTFVTIAATKGIPINVVASITGQNPATTMKHYMGVVSAEKFKEITEKFKFT